MSRPLDFIKQRALSLGVKLERARHSLSKRREQLFAQAEINHCIDVGANLGQYARSLRAAGYLAAIDSFEPIQPVFKQLQARAQKDPNWQVHPYACADYSGDAEIFVAEQHAASSLLALQPLGQRSSPGAQAQRKEKVQVTRLDQILKSNPGARSHLKVDTQGTELAVLKGAQALLPQIHTIELELSLQELYQGQPLLSEMLQELSALGFLPIWLERGFTSEQGEMLQVDALFRRREQNH